MLNSKPVTKNHRPADQSLRNIQPESHDANLQPYDRQELLPPINPQVSEQLCKLRQSLLAIKPLDSYQFVNSQTAIVYIDIVEGFVNIGNLHSPRAGAILQNIVKLDTNPLFKTAHRLYFTDAHPADAVEFQTFPPHCLIGSAEAELVPELVCNPNDALSRRFYKNSTNGFILPEFQSYLQAHPKITTFIVCGLVTDICVLQFSLSLKAYFNQINQNSHLLLPINAVQTFDNAALNHDGDLMHLFGLYNLKLNGIELTYI